MGVFSRSAPWPRLPLLSAMAPKAMKAMKAKAMKSAKSLSKGGLAEAVSTATEIKKTGKLTIPGICMVKTRVRPATKAGKREMFGKVVVVKARPAKTVVKAYAVAAIKKAI